MVKVLLVWELLYTPKELSLGVSHIRFESGSATSQLYNLETSCSGVVISKMRIINLYITR